MLSIEWVFRNISGRGGERGRGKGRGFGFVFGIITFVFGFISVVCFYMFNFIFRKTEIGIVTIWGCFRDRKSSWM